MQTSAVPIPKPGNQLWGIYYTDREYARSMGDPLRTVVEAPTQFAAEEIAGRLGLKSPWAHPVTTEQAKQVLGIQENHIRYRRQIHTKSLARHPSLNMQTPTTTQLHTAIEVLRKLGERLIEQAAHSVMQLPETHVGDQCAARIEARAIERTGQIQLVTAQLENWRSELNGQRRQCVSYDV